MRQAGARSKVPQRYAPQLSRIEGSATLSEKKNTDQDTDASDEIAGDASEDTHQSAVSADHEPASQEDGTEDVKPDADAVEPVTPDSDTAETASPDTDVESPVSADPPIAEEKIVERVIETKRGGFVPALIGGAIAALIGFAVAQSNSLESYLPGPLKDANAETLATLQETVAAQAKEMSALKEQVAAPDLSGIESQLSTLTPLPGQLGDLKAQTAALSDELSKFEARLAQVESAPVTGAASQEAVAAYEQELATMQAALAKQRTEVEDMLAAARTAEAQANATAKLASARTALAQIQSALDSGTSFTGALEVLRDSGQQVPDALSGPAQDGVATTTVLADTFAPAARAALASVRSEGSTSGSVTAFLQRQLGARSVTPRDGDDADSVLSRAEAAAENGKLGDALTEVAKLPESAQADMAEWASMAKTRQAALEAVAAMGQSLNSN